MLPSAGGIIPPRYVGGDFSYNIFHTIGYGGLLQLATDLIGWEGSGSGGAKGTLAPALVNNVMEYLLQFPNF